MDLPAFIGYILDKSGYLTDIKENEDEMEKLVEKLELPMVMAMMLEETNADGATSGNVADTAGAGAAAQEKVMESLPETMTEQTAAAYIRSAYEKIGLDLDKISSSYILVTGGKMLALAGAGMAASILVGLIASLVGAGLGRNLRKDVFRKVVDFSNGEFDQFSTASLITRSTNDIQQIQLLTVMILRMVLYAPILAVGGIWNVFHTNVDMSWIIALAVALIFLLVAVLFAVVMPRFRILQNLVDRLNLVSREILTGLPVIRAFSRERYEEKLCWADLVHATDAYEWSFVAVPAQREAGVMKSMRQDMEKLEREAALGRKYLERLKGEVVRLGGLAGLGLEHATLEAIAGKLEEPELEGLRRAFEKQVDKTWGAESQLCRSGEQREEERRDGAFLI